MLKRSTRTTSWLNHAVVPKNTGSNTGAVYNFGFTPAVGSLLVLIGAGPVTWSTPTGYTQRSLQLSSGAIYLFTKTAASGDTSITVNHNGSGMAAYPAVLEVWEFPTGSSWVKTASGHLGTPADALPGLSALTGTNSIFWTAVLQNGVLGSAATMAFNIGTPLGSSYQQGTSDGSVYNSTYVDGFTGAASTANTYTSTNTAATGEAMTFAVNVP